MSKITISFKGEQGQEAYHEAEVDYRVYAIFDQLLYLITKEANEKAQAE